LTTDLLNEGLPVRRPAGPPLCYGLRHAIDVQSGWMQTINRSRLMSAARFAFGIHLGDIIVKFGMIRIDPKPGSRCIAAIPL